MDHHQPAAYRSHAVYRIILYEAGASPLLCNAVHNYDGGNGPAEHRFTLSYCQIDH